MALAVAATIVKKKEKKWVKNQSMTEVIKHTEKETQKLKGVWATGVGRCWRPQTSC